MLEEDDEGDLEVTDPPLNKAKSALPFAAALGGQKTA